MKILTAANGVHRVDEPDAILFYKKYGSRNVTCLPEDSEWEEYTHVYIMDTVAGCEVAVLVDGRIPNAIFDFMELFRGMAVGCVARRYALRSIECPK